MKSSLFKSMVIIASLSLLLLGFQNCSGGGSINESYFGGSGDQTSQGTDDNDSDGSEGSQSTPDKIQIDSQSAASHSKLVGEEFTLSVTASGSDNMSYQWYHNSQAMIGEVQSSLTIQSLVEGDAGTYFVLVSDNNGFKDPGQSDNMVLSVSTNPSITRYDDPSFSSSDKTYPVNRYVADSEIIINNRLLAFCRAKMGEDAVVDDFDVVENVVQLTKWAYYIGSGPCFEQEGFESLGNDQFCGVDREVFELGPIGVLVYSHITCRIP